MIDSTTLAHKVATLFADKEAKKMVISKYSAEYTDGIKNTPWTELLDGKIPKVTISENAKKYHKEIYDMLSGFLTEELPALFEEKYTKENLDEDISRLFFEEIRYAVGEERAVIIKKELAHLCKYYLIAKNNGDLEGAKVLLTSALRAKEQFA